MPTPIPDADELIAAADRCVKCGLCLPTCPTYRLDRQEGESPRGRVALVDALARGQVTGAQAAAHLGSCLQCLNCSTTCPSLVDTRTLLHRGRELTTGNRRLRWLASLASSARRIRLGVGMARLLGPLAPFQRLSSQATKAVRPTRASGIANGNRAVVLAGGCADNGMRGGTLSAIARVLRATGLQVSIPAPDRCCGALEYHHYGSDAGLRHRERWFESNQGSNADTPVLHASSACVAFAREQPSGQQVFEVCGWAVADRALQGVEFAPLPGRVAIHTPCSQRNQLKDDSSTASLLRHIPGLEAIEVDGLGCCGAAGLAMLAEAERAHTLGASVVEQARQAGARYLVSTNAGCLLHLGATTDRPNAPEVLHPFELLDRQLRVADNSL